MGLGNLNFVVGGGVYNFSGKLPYPMQKLVADYDYKYMEYRFAATNVVGDTIVFTVSAYKFASSPQDSALIFREATKVIHVKRHTAPAQTHRLMIGGERNGSLCQYEELAIDVPCYAPLLPLNMGDDSATQKIETERYRAEKVCVVSTEPDTDSSLLESINGKKVHMLWVYVHSSVPNDKIMGMIAAIFEEFPETKFLVPHIPFWRK